jgi:hypothetical protein
MVHFFSLSPDRTLEFRNNQRSESSQIQEFFMSKQTRARLSILSSQLTLSQTLQTTQIEPSEPLDELELVAFNKLIQARETATWSSHDVATATSLARQLVLHARLIETVKAEGVMVEHERKGLVAHPALAAAVALSGAIKNWSAMLGLTASQRGVSGARQDVRNQHEQAMRDPMAGAGRGLLA